MGVIVPAQRTLCEGNSELLYINQNRINCLYRRTSKGNQNVTHSDLAITYHSAYTECYKQPQEQYPEAFNPKYNKVFEGFTNPNKYRQRTLCKGKPIRLTTCIMFKVCNNLSSRLCSS